MKKLLPVVMMLLLAPAMAWSQGLQVSSLTGKVEIRAAASKTFQALTPTARQVQVGDQIRTSAGASVVLTLPDSSYMLVMENSDLVIKDVWSGGFRNMVNIMLGHVRFVIERVGGRPNPYRVDTPTALIAVRGTTFDVDVDASQTTEVICLDGQVGVENIALPNREVILNPGFRTRVVPGVAPLMPVAHNGELSPNRTLHVVKKGPEGDGNSLDPKAFEKYLRDNDRANRPTDRSKSPLSGTDSNVGRAKLSFPE